LTVWSRAASVATAPLATVVANAASAATCQRTVTSAPRPDPGTASGVGVTRVHSRMPSGNGSPDATP
jgi:hypothetical protein